MKFVQFADTHLDSTLGGAMNLSQDKKAVVRQDLRTAFKRACQLTLEHSADLLLIPGDVFDFECLRPETTNFIVECFENIAPARVFITPGNHDSLRPGSPFMSSYGITWPDNVHIFGAAEFESVVLYDLDCSVTGIGHAHRGHTGRLLSSPITRKKAGINILLFHGSRDGYKPTDKETIIPFSDEELIAQGFDYAAIGHYHSFSTITDPEGRIKGAYSGCIQGRGLDECGEKYVVLGEIDSEGKIGIKKIEVAGRRVLRVDVNISGISSNSELVGRAERALAESGVRDCDLVSLVLKGSISPTLKIDICALEEYDECFHIHVDNSGTEPDYDLDALTENSAASSVKSEYVRRILKMIDEAPDEQQAAVLRDAIYYGLYALDGRDLEPRDAS